MTNAFSVLSLKRHQSSSRINSRKEEGSIHSKVSRLKLLRFYVLSKFTNPISSERLNQRNIFSHRQKDEEESIISKNQHVKQQYDHYINDNVERNLYSAPLLTNKKKKLKSILVNHHHKKSIASSIAAPSYVSDPTNQYYSSHISISNITINSEDLTAKEFASLAGIQILPEEEEDSDEEIEEERRISDDDNTSILHTISSSFDNNISNSILSRQSRDSALRPKIWDNEFWTKPNKHKQSISRKEDLPILNEFRRMGTCISEKSSVIRKGRFEIYLEN